MEDRKEALTQVAWKDIASVWPRVLPQLKALLRICPDDFTAEDVYWYLKAERAWLFLIEDGFCVLEVSTDPFGGKKTLCVWLLYWLKAEENQAQLLTELEALARKSGCCRIHFKSPRMGWMKKVNGFNLKMITWEREIK
jgi:hypothetical protein